MSILDVLAVYYLQGSKKDQDPFAITHTYFPTGGCHE
jgi:hypothetical protein